MFQVASSVKPSLRSNIPKPNSIPRNGRCLDTQITYIISGIGASFCHWATADVFRATGERRIQMGTARWNGIFLQTPFFACCGIALKHSMDTTRHVFCSTSTRNILERVCFRLHPESSLRCLQNIPNPRTYQETKDFWIPGLHRRNRRMALFCAF